MTISPAIVLEERDDGQTDRRPHFPFNGPEIVKLSVDSILSILRDKLIQKLQEDTRLASKIHAFPEAGLHFGFQFVLTMAPQAEGRQITISDSIKVPNIDLIPPDATRILNDMPVLVEEPSKLALAPGKVDVEKSADQIDPRLKQHTEQKFANAEPFQAAVKAATSTAPKSTDQLKTK